MQHENSIFPRCAATKFLLRGVDKARTVNWRLKKDREGFDGNLLFLPAPHEACVWRGMDDHRRDPSVRAMMCLWCHQLADAIYLPHLVI